MSAAAISFEDVHQSYGSEADAVLRGVDLTIARSEFCVILGRSGMGKSTLLRCVNGFVRPFRGRVTVDGEPVTASRGGLRRLRRRTGVIFQSYNLVSRLTARQNVLCGMLPDLPPYRSLPGLFTRAEQQQALSLLRDVGLEEHADRRADQLSGGQKQRVGIARALAQDPEIIRADEPVASLDPVASQDILALLRRINETHGITVVVSLHQVDYARMFGRRIVALREGRLAVDTAAADLTPAHIETIYGPSPERTPKESR